MNGEVGEVLRNVSKERFSQNNYFLSINYYNRYVKTGNIYIFYCYILYFANL